MEGKGASKRKTYFSYWNGKYEIDFRNEFDYRTRDDEGNETEHYYKEFRVIKNYETKASICFKRCKPGIIYNTCGYSDNKHTIFITLFFLSIFIKLPIRNKKKDVEYGEDVNDPEPTYSMYLYGEDWWPSTFVIQYGKTYKSFDFPFSLQFYKHLVIKNGKFVEQGSYLAKEHVDPDLTNVPFTYRRSDGLVQEVTARCHIDVIEWRRKWMMWTPFLNCVSRTVDIEFYKDDKVAEIGNVSGGWKGGTTGCSCPMTNEEFNNRDIVSAVKRYERKCNKTHEHD